MPVARAELQLAASLLVELLVAMAEEDNEGDQTPFPEPVASTPEPLTAGA